MSQMSQIEIRNKITNYSVKKYNKPSKRRENFIMTLYLIQSIVIFSFTVSIMILNINNNQSNGYKHQKNITILCQVIFFIICFSNLTFSFFLKIKVKIYDYQEIVNSIDYRLECINEGTEELINIDLIKYFKTNTGDLILIDYKIKKIIPMTQLKIVSIEMDDGFRDPEQITEE